MKFNREGISTVKTPEFQMLEEMEKDIQKAYDIVKILEDRRSDLEFQIRRGTEIPHELVQKYLKIKEKMLDEQ